MSGSTRLERLIRRFVLNDQFTSHALNFNNGANGGVDPRTGLFNVEFLLGDIIGNHNQGPCFRVAMAYSPLQTKNVGFGVGFSTRYSQYDTETRLLALSNGEQYRVGGTLESPIILQKHTDHFRFEHALTDGESSYRILWKDGSTEILTGIQGNDTVKVPHRTLTPVGHGLTWKWNVPGVNQGPRLESVSDDTGAIHLSVAYAEDISTSLTFWPDTPEQYKVVLHFFNGYTSSIVRGDLRTGFTYETVGDDITSQERLFLSRVEYATGRIDEVRYDSQAMQFPQGTTLLALPAAVQLSIAPGADQPAVITKFEYSENNYLAAGAECDWSEALDPLYGILSEYDYWSKEKLMIDDKEHIVTQRTYNNFHLQTNEKISCGPCDFERRITYHAELGKSLEDQPKSFLLPKMTSVTWTDGSVAEGANSRTETTYSSFDESGNPLTETQPDGTLKTFEYYSADGEVDPRGQVLCPAEPNGFMRLMKRVTVRAPEVKCSETEKPLTAPVIETRYTYRAFDARAGTPVSAAVLQASEHHFVDDSLVQSITRDYVASPIDTEHGRMSTETVVFYDGRLEYKTKKAFAFDVGKERPYDLRQTVVSTAHDQLQISEERVQSLYSGRLLEEADAQGLRTMYAYDSLGRLVSETRNADSIYKHVMRYEYEKNQDGLFLIRVDALGNKSKEKFDGMGRVIQSWRWDLDSPWARWLETGRYAYDATGRLATHETYDWTIDGAKSADINQTEQISYDQWGQTLSNTFSDGLTSIQRYDPITRTKTLELVGPNGARSALREVFHDARGHPSMTREYTTDSVSRTLYSTRHHVHDAIGRLRRDVDEFGRTTRYEYDAHNRVKRIELAEGTAIKKEYATFSAEPLICAIGVETRPSGDVKTIKLGEQSFDGLGRLTFSKSGARTYTYEYEKAASTAPNKVVTPDGVTLRYTHIPALGDAVASVRAYRRWWHVWGPDIEQEFKYAPLSGTTVQARTNDSVVTELDYYASGRLKGEAQATKEKKTPFTNHAYSLGGRLTFSTDVTGAQQKFEYDHLGRVASISDPAVSVKLSYNELGRLNQWIANDLSSSSLHTLTTTLSFDHFGREVSRSIVSNRGQTWRIAQTWLTNHQLGSRMFSYGGEASRTEQYEYDARNRLTRYRCSGSDVPVNEFGKRVTSQTFSFDALDNITCCVSEFDGGKNIATFKYSENDPCQLVSVANTHAAWPTRLVFEYDKAGRMLNNEHGHELEYDALGRLSSVSSSHETSRYGYDAWNRLISQEVGENTELLYYRAETLINRISGSDANDDHRLIRMGPLSFAQVSEGSKSKAWLTGTSERFEVVAASDGEQLVGCAYGPYGEQLER